MEEKRYLLNLLAQFPNVKESKIQYSKIPVDALSFVKLCHLLSENGRVLETDETAHSVIAALSASTTSMNEGVAAVLLLDKTLYLAAYAKEGLFKQHTAERIIQRITELVN